MEIDVRSKSSKSSKSSTSVVVARMRVEFHYIHWQLYAKIYRDPPGPDGGTVTLKKSPDSDLSPSTRR